MKLMVSLGLWHVLCSPLAIASVAILTAKQLMLFTPQDICNPVNAERLLREVDGIGQEVRQLAFD